MNKGVEFFVPPPPPIVDPSGAAAAPDPGFPPLPNIKLKNIKLKIPSLFNNPKTKIVWEIIDTKF